MAAGLTTPFFTIFTLCFSPFLRNHCPELRQRRARQIRPAPLPAVAPQAFSGLGIQGGSLARQLASTPGTHHPRDWNKGCFAKGNKCLAKHP
jgi:hypothetical protein